MSDASHRTRREDLEALLTLMQHIIEAFSEPAWIVVEGGRARVANRAARRIRGLDPPPKRDRWVRRRRLSVSGARATLVVQSQSSSHAAQMLGLPERLQGVAERVAEGKTDKQIAAELDLSVTSVRTYTSRIYRRLGINSRTELARRLLLPDEAPTAGATKRDR